MNHVLNNYDATPSTNPGATPSSSAAIGSGSFKARSSRGSAGSVTSDISIGGRSTVGRKTFQMGVRSAGEPPSNDSGVGRSTAARHTTNLVPQRNASFGGMLGMPEKFSLPGNYFGSLTKILIVPSLLHLLSS